MVFPYFFNPAVPLSCRLMSNASGIQEESLIPWQRSISSGIAGSDSRGRNLDFMVIGAPKSGTTSLHKYLAAHPALYLLPEKEVPYFTNPDYLALGWDWYVDKFFSEAPTDRLWGKTTPQYMSLIETPARIWGQMPKVKLIALVRNPVDCAYSWYKMMLRRKQEQRPFEQMLDGLMQSGRPGDGNDRPSLFIGEHGRMLEQYFKTFPARQLLVLFSEDLKRDPGAVLKRLLTFLEVDETFTPPNLGRCYHAGGTRQRIPVNEETLAQHPCFRLALKLLPHRSRKAIERRFLFWFMIWNIRPDSSDQQMPGKSRERLVQFYRDDVRLLKQLLNQPVPWPEFADA